MPIKSKAKARSKSATRKNLSRKSAATARGTGRGPAIKQIVSMLEDDHSQVEKLFKRYEKLKKADDESRFELAEQICKMLKVHTTLEEELVYPAARDVLADEDDLIDEAEVEHASAKQLIADIEQLETSDPMFDAKVKVLGEYIDHHVEEEEDEMFPKLRKSAEDQFDGMFEQLTEMRASLESELESEAGPGKRRNRQAQERRTAEAS